MTGAISLGTPSSLSRFELTIWQALSAGEMHNAAALAAAYWAEQSSGVSFKHSAEEYAAHLARIFSARPATLNQLGGSDWHALRVIAGAAELTGHKTEQFIPDGLRIAGRLSVADAARQVAFAAIDARERADIFEAFGDVPMEVLCSSDPCPECLALSQSRPLISSMPPLPYAFCSSPHGCRCDAVPVIPD